MDWHEAYLTQARSDQALLLRLSDPRIEYCHRLHYLQMVTEKLAKAILTPAGQEAPAPARHAMLAKMIRSVRARRDIARRMGFGKAHFRFYLTSLLPLAHRIERLSPDQAGFTMPNPEYPWRDLAGTVRVPATYGFPEFDPRDPSMRRMQRFVSDLLCLTV